MGSIPVDVNLFFVLFIFKFLFSFIFGDPICVVANQFVDICEYCKKKEGWREGGREGVRE